MLYTLLGVGLTPFHADESTQIMMSRDYHYQFIAGDWSQVLYHDPPLNATEQHLRLLNGTVSKYLFGLAWHSGGYTVADLNEQWLWGASWDWNAANGHIPTDDLLQRTRWISALLTALSVPVMFGLGCRWAGRGTAYAASFLLAIHPVILLHGRRAYMEGTLLFFSLLTILVAIWWTNHLSGKTKRRGAGWLLPLGLGISAGLTVASKHSGLVAVGAAYLGLLIIIVRAGWQNQPMTRRTFITLIGSGLLSLIVFFALNPAWWGNPLVRIPEVLALRTGLLADQSAAFPEAIYSGLGDRLNGLFYQLTTAPLAYYEVSAWADYIAEPITAYQSSPWTGVQTGTTTLTTLWGMSLFLLSLVGLGRLLQDMAHQHPAAIISGLWGGLTLLFIVLTIPLAWQRYYMPLYSVQVLLAGAGFVTLVGWLTAQRWRGPDHAAHQSG